jgi:beta-glucosidase
MRILELKAFQRVSVKRAQTAHVTLPISITEFEKSDMDNHRWKLYPGSYTLSIGKIVGKAYYRKSSF